MLGCLLDSQDFNITSSLLFTQFRTANSYIFKNPKIENEVVAKVIPRNELQYIRSFL